MSQAKQKLGRWGESLAATFLADLDYVVLERNVYTPHGEIDIVACTPDEKQMVFVEVKTRSNGAFGLPEEAVDARKRQHLLDSGRFYVQQHPDLPGSWRIDVIAIRRMANGLPEITHFENAFS